MNELQVLAEAQRALGLTHAVEIARGGQKIVYRAQLGGTRVILKVALLSDAHDPNALERCRREVVLLRGFNSVNLVRVLSELQVLGSGPDAAAWVEEELDGADLRTLLDSQWSWAQTLGLLEGVGSGLAAMHSSGYVHRDLSPGNVRLTTHHWKIMDPGLAKHLDRTSITGLWQPGTPGFLSPEHASLGGRITPASDVYCLGILAYLVLTGRLPIDHRGSPTDYRERLLAGTFTPVQHLRPDLTDSQAALIDRCLTRQPARRYLDAGEALVALQQLQQLPEIGVI